MTEDRVNSKPIGSVFVVAKGDKEQACALGREVCTFLEGLGVATVMCHHVAGAGTCLADGARQSFDLALVLGGDGTFISAARQLAEPGIPLMGVNLGQVGFLTELSPTDWRERLPAVIAGGYDITPRLVLDYQVLRDGKLLHQGLAVNDIVISRGVLARLIRLGVSYDGRAVISMRSDGIIVSTPIGSTAYGFSAGGPLLAPGVPAFSLVPICPFLNGLRPMVLPADKRLEIEVQGEPGDVSITEDGRAIVNLQSGDVVAVERYEHDLLLAETGQVSFFDKLKTKEFLLER
ncbi:MAG: NAD(+)/NADH kinase [Proteobacteria bacterium]|nr:NAD(+)/NADH kinase [Pseudomonadota bacterium]MBU1612408.1 NAD(+)/NADH kinase [Pseudomonadota bacterium]